MIHEDVKHENLLVRVTGGGRVPVDDDDASDGDDGGGGEPLRLHALARGARLQCQLIDFGNAMALDDQAVYHTEFGVQTLGYRAPELLLGCAPFGCEVDAWAAGVMVAELAAGGPFLPLGSVASPPPGERGATAAAVAEDASAAAASAVGLRELQRCSRFPRGGGRAAQQRPLAGGERAHGAGETAVPQPTPASARAAARSARFAVRPRRRACLASDEGNGGAVR